MKMLNAAGAIVAALMLGPAPAWALHKCTTKEGKVIYTEFECEKDAKTSGVVIHHSSGVDGTKGAPPKSPPAAGAPKSGAPAPAAPASATPASGTPAPGTPAPGSPAPGTPAPGAAPKGPVMPAKDTITEMREAQKKMADEAVQRQREAAEAEKNKR